jgi:protein TonB
MEAKKNPAIDPTSKSTYFFSIGLVIALSLVITAFEWESRISLVLPDNPEPRFDTLMVIPSTDIPQPPAPRQAVAPTFIEVASNLPADSVLIPDILDAPAYSGVEFQAPPVEESDPIVDFVEFPATPGGGFKGFYQFVGETIQYPVQAKRIGIDGKVYVQFIVNRDGTLSDVRILKGIGGGCDEEAVRVVRSSPPWTPAQQAGRTVRQRFTLPIQFNLEHH